jgi:hypothetical protein
MPHFKNTNNDLYWLDEGDDPAVWLPQCTPITDAEADAIRTAQQTAAEAALTYADKRRAEYPAIGDQLDALWKGGDAAAEMLAAVQAVKAKYPKGA